MAFKVRISGGHKMCPNSNDTIVSWATVLQNAETQLSSTLQNAENEKEKF